MRKRNYGCFRCRGILFSDGEPLKVGDTMKNALLADTLTRIRDNATDIYNPSSTLVQDILDDIGPGTSKTSQLTLLLPPAYKV